MSKKVHRGGESSTSSRTLDGAPAFVTPADKATLFLRLFIGVVLFTQAITKSQDYLWLEGLYPSILGLSPSTVLSAVGVLEAVAGVMLTVGLLTRAVSVVMIVAMLAAAFLFFPHQGFAQAELKVVYAGIYATLAISGGGRYALDTMVFQMRSWRIDER